MATAPDDHRDKSFLWPEFISAMAPLNKRTAMEYFSYSPWYRLDPPSNNQILRMQNTGMDQEVIDEEEQLKKFIGVEFVVVVDNGPDLFIIHKRERTSPEQATPLEAYYILHNRIQQAPDVYSLIANRLNASIHNILSSMNTLRAHRPTFTPTKGHVWPVSFDPTSAFTTTKKVSGHSNVASTAATPAPEGTGNDESYSSESGPSNERAGSVLGGGQSTSTPSNLSGKREVTMPLLHAIRTTAAHTRILSPLPPAAADTGATTADTIAKSKPVSAQTLASTLVAQREAREAALLQAQQAAQALSHSLSLNMNHPGMMRRVSSTPGPGTPRPGSVPGTPGGIGEGSVKKKKKRLAKDTSPAVALSPGPGAPPF